jgi:RES domain-containing protein
MKVWRLVSTAFATSAFDGEGAARYTGRWNPRGVRMVYTADSLALATLELSVHLAGARVEYAAIEVEIADEWITDLRPRQLTSGWADDIGLTQRLGERWVRSSSSLALGVPSSLVDPRSGERNVLINPVHPQQDSIVELQRFEIVIDERLR